MRFGIPSLGDRIAPRCTFAEKVLVVDVENNRVESRKNVRLPGNTSIDLMEMLVENRVETLICGGISNENIEWIHSLDIAIIDNVSSTLDDIVEALRLNVIHPGYGFDRQKEASLPSRGRTAKENKLEIKTDETTLSSTLNALNCVDCEEMICLSGQKCPISPQESEFEGRTKAERMLSVAADVAQENEPQLCRISELIYFCLDMGYKNIGIAFCYDLIDATRVLVNVLKRFFNVYPVCCKIASNPLEVDSQKPSTHRLNRHPCNPLGQAEVLNRWGSDLNVLAGLCMGTDCIFTQASESPVTTLFVKDKSLANNPIGAVYSNYYLKEISKSTSSHK